MELLLSAAEKHLAGFNRKAHSWEDIEKICKTKHVNLKVCEYGPDVLGYFCIRRTPRRTKRFIVVNSRLDEIDRVFTGLHELGHFFLHEPVSAGHWFYCSRNAKLIQRKHDAEADFFALIAMIPLWMLIDLHAVNFVDIDPRLVPYLKKRLLIYHEFGV